MQLLHAQRLHDPTPGRYAAPSPLANGVMPHGRGAPNRIRQIMFWNMFWNSSGTSCYFGCRCCTLLTRFGLHSSHRQMSHVTRHMPHVRRHVSHNSLSNNQYMSAARAQAASAASFYSNPSPQSPAAVWLVAAAAVVCVSLLQPPFCCTVPSQPLTHR